MSNPWNEFKPPAGDFPDKKVEWSGAGVSIVGTVSNLRFVKFPGDAPEKSPTPELWVIDANGDEWQVTCGPQDLQIQLHEQQPVVGDQIAIAMLGEQKIAATGRTKKTFKVAVRKAELAASVALHPSTPPPPPQAADLPPFGGMDPNIGRPTEDVASSLFSGATVEGTGQRLEDADDLFKALGQ